jgi:hypothetical protein
MIHSLFNVSVILWALTVMGEGYPEPKRVVAQERAMSQESSHAASAVVLQFLEALKTGNVRVLDSLLGGDLSIQMKPLLQDNQDYPEYLRQHYSQTTFSIDHLVEKLGVVMARVTVDFPGGPTQTWALTLKKAKTGEWKIMKRMESR